MYPFFLYISKLLNWFQIKFRVYSGSEMVEDLSSGRIFGTINDNTKGLAFNINVSGRFDPFNIPGLISESIALNY